jgi:ketosteroid isomerase-like protein
VLKKPDTFFNNQDMATTNKVLTTQEVANQLVFLCRNGQVEEAKEELFAEDVISIEPQQGLLPVETRGMENIRRKAERFMEAVDCFYGDIISDPVVAGDYFSLAWTSDLQMKGEKRKTNAEICVYRTRNGKIIAEQFFY